MIIAVAEIWFLDGHIEYRTPPLALKDGAWVVPGSWVTARDPLRPQMGNSRLELVIPQGDAVRGVEERPLFKEIAPQGAGKAG